MSLGRLIISVLGSVSLLATPVAAQVQSVFGLDHHAVGQAVLGTSGGGLTISNIGSSGKDGVSIDPDGAKFLDFDRQLPDPATLPSSTHYSAGYANCQGALVFAVRAQPAPGGAGWSYVLEQAPSWVQGVRVLAFDKEGNEVASADLPATPGTTLYTLGDPGTPVSSRIAGFEASETDPTVWCTFSEVPVSVTIPGQGPVRAIHNESVFLGTPPAGAGLCQVELTGTSVAATGFSLSDEALGVFGHAHRAEGDAKFQYDYVIDTLNVSNIGSSGQDGVSITPPWQMPAGTPPTFQEVSGLGVEFESFGMPASSGLSVSFDGGDAGLRGLMFERVGSQIQTSVVGFSGPRSVQVLSGGAVVGQQVLGVDNIALGQMPPANAELLGSVVTTQTGPSHGVQARFPPGSVFDIGGQILTGDTLRVLALASMGPLYPAGWEMQILAHGIPALTIKAEPVVETPWQDLGFALAGSVGEPQLTGHGLPQANSIIAVELDGGRASAFSILFVSFSSTPTPFKGGTLVTVPVGLSVPLTTDPLGELSLSAAWPAGLPVGAPVFWQVGIADGGAPAGAALSNALQMTTL
ncbi:MAG: hypothetical protein DRQ55_15970 [Planctomycetota bacterium]|nr:MAG: hypothetical protein DRQ55_15970 [Planctomycetota bacterium]